MNKSQPDLPHLRRDWAQCCHICAGTGLAAATSAPGLGSPLPTSAPGLCAQALNKYKADVVRRGILTQDEVTEMQTRYVRHTLSRVE